MKKPIVIAVVLLAAASSFGAGRIWNFDKDSQDGPAAGFYRAAGSWRVHCDPTAPSPPHVLAQAAKTSKDAFNILFVSGSSYRNVDISVKIRAVAGSGEQGGGIVWRARDARNYYVARYNPLQGNFRLYRVMNNTPVELATADIVDPQGWHRMRVVAKETLITCYLDGKRYLEIRDNALTGEGPVGLWTRGDAQTFFDDLEIAPQ